MRVWSVGVCAWWLVLCATHAQAEPLSRAALLARSDAAFTAAYNLNYDEAGRLARQLVADAPEESLAHRTLATVLWMHLLFDRGAFTIDHYLGSLAGGQIELPPPPPERAAAFTQAVQRAVSLADAAVRRRPADLDARYDLGVAHGLHSSWVATVEGRVTAALGSARTAFNAHEHVLERAPGRSEAGLIVGTYRYAIAALSMLKRWAAYLVGFGGGKEKGIALLERAAQSPITRADAQMALVLVYSREGRQGEALAILKQLRQEFPDNRLLQLEAASAAWRAGRAAEAEALITDGLARLERDSRPRGPGERALWIYKRGMARVSLNHLTEAEADLRRALTDRPTGWVEGRIHLELGKIADLQGNRRAALSAYSRGRQLCATNRDPWCIEQAEIHQKRPFAFSPQRDAP